MDNQTARIDHAAATVPPARTDDVDGLTAADVMHGEVDGLSPSLTVGELRACGLPSAAAGGSPCSQSGADEIVSRKVVADRRLTNQS